MLQQYLAACVQLIVDVKGLGRVDDVRVVVEGRLPGGAGQRAGSPGILVGEDASGG